MLFFATCARGLEPIVAKELAALGAGEVRETVAGVRCEGELETLYRVGYCIRAASRWLLNLAESEIADADGLYDLARGVPWYEHFGAEDRFAIHVAGQSALINDSRFAMLRVKDAIADVFRERDGRRPFVDAESPDASIHVALKGRRATISLDLIGGSLHERGWRAQGHEAPIKETLAAGMLLRAGWPFAVDWIADPFCGSGTLLIEALQIAARVPAQRMREHFAWLRWRGHDAQRWAAVRASCDAAIDFTALPRAFGSDSEASAIRIARSQSALAGLAPHCEWQRADARAFAPPPGSGFVVGNLPYGERLGDERQWLSLHREFGAALKARAVGARFALLTGSETLARATELRAQKVTTLHNGAIECALITGEVQAPRAIEGPPKFKRAGAEMVYNRILKNRRRLKPYLERHGIECYRIYDADIPEYAAAIDVYADRVHIQEYQAPAEIPTDKTAERFDDIVIAARRALEVPRERLYLKQRRPQTPGEQYQRQANTGDFFTVRENGALFEVNLADYLDTGVFLDGRQIRSWIAESTRDAHVLNLFCYTATASVAAALGGARSSVSVDLSPTYTAWAERNFRLNGLTAEHRIVTADAVEWLKTRSERFDFIYLDPPSFSNSKRTRTVLDVQRDHVDLLRSALAHLKPGGRLLFVCNLRRFKLSDEVNDFAAVTDVTEASIPPDFARDARIHRAFWLTSRL